jgi:hypothetical protein
MNPWWIEALNPLQIFLEHAGKPTHIWGKTTGEIQNSLKYKFRENMVREKFRVFSLKKFRVNYSEFFFRIWLRTTIGSQEKNSEFFFSE